MINLILCGGSGTRLWPLSRTKLPKQFVRLFDNHSLFQDTVLRNQVVCHKTMIVSNNEQFFLAVDQLEQIGAGNNQFLLEPVGRNTAPAIALACMALNRDDLVLVTPSDHLIKVQTAYELAVLEAKSLAKQGYLVTFGIKPTHPEVGFGYIEANGRDVQSFKEKPDVITAQSYIDQGNYYWNSGIFCFKAGVFLEALQQYAPEIYQPCLNALPEQRGTEIWIDLDMMNAIPEDSIDYAVMEQSDKVKVIPCSMGWSDLGSFDALYDELSSEGKQLGLYTPTHGVVNSILSRVENSPEPICIDSTNNLLVTRDRQIALIDVNDLLIIDTSDAILISKKGSSKKLKQLLIQIKKQAPELAEIHHLVHRPWGTYEVLQSSGRCKVKRIIVKPNSKLSLQKHFHRSEHWIVVSGTATVTVDDQVFLVCPNESTYIKMGQCHRLENEGKIELVMIEVQVGEYTGEDDIVRIKDIYGR